MYVVEQNTFEVLVLNDRLIFIRRLAIIWRLDIDICSD